MPAHAPVPCPSCRALILWTTTPAERRLPVDAEPTPAGNVAVSQDVEGQLRGRVLRTSQPTVQPFERLYMPHFATCKAPPPKPRPRTTRQRAGVRPGTWRPAR